MAIVQALNSCSQELLWLCILHVDVAVGLIPRPLEPSLIRPISAWAEWELSTSPASGKELLVSSPLSCRQASCHGTTERVLQLTVAVALLVSISATRLLALPLSIAATLNAASSYT